MQLTLKSLWIKHIERFSDRLRPRLYDALIGYLLYGTPIPEKLMPFLGILLDLMEIDGDKPMKTYEASPAEKQLLEEYKKGFAEGIMAAYKIDYETFEAACDEILACWYRPNRGGHTRPDHADIVEFARDMSGAFYDRFIGSAPEVGGEKHQDGVDFKTSGEHNGGEHPLGGRWHSGKAGAVAGEGGLETGVAHARQRADVGLKGRDSHKGQDGATGHNHHDEQAQEGHHL